MLHGESRQRRKSRSVTRVGQRIECRQRALGLGSRQTRRIIESAGGIDRRHDGLELCQAALLDGQSNGRLLRLIAMTQSVDQGFER